MKSALSLCCVVDTRRHVIAEGIVLCLQGGRQGMGNAKVLMGPLYLSSCLYRALPVQHDRIKIATCLWLERKDQPMTSFLFNSFEGMRSPPTMHTYFYMTKTNAAGALA